MNLTEIKAAAEAMSTEDYGRLAAQRDWLIERVEELAEAWKDTWADLVAVQGFLVEPFADDPRWTPWTRFVEMGIDRMEDALARLEGE